MEHVYKASWKYLNFYWSYRLHGRADRWTIGQTIAHNSTRLIIQFYIYIDKFYVFATTKLVYTKLVYIATCFKIIKILNATYFIRRNILQNYIITFYFKYLFSYLFCLLYLCIPITLIFGKERCNTSGNQRWPRKHAELS